MLPTHGKACFKLIHMISVDCELKTVCRKRAAWIS